MNLQQRSKLLLPILILVLANFAVFGVTGLQGQPKSAAADVASSDDILFLPIVLNQWMYEPPSCYRLTLTHSGQGTDPVASPDRSAACADKGDYVGGENIQLSSAAPDAGWNIAGWTGTSDDASTAAANSVTMPTTDHTAGVNYARTCYRLTLTHSGQGTDPVASPDKSAACADKGDYVGGETIQLSSATPETGWHIVGWTGTGDDTSSATINSLSMPVGDHAASVIYDKLGCYRLTLTHSGQGTDPVASPDKSAACTEKGDYVAGEKIQLSSAAPDAGWHIADWTGTSDDASTAAANSVTMPTTDHTAGVNYARTCYRLTLTHSGQGTDPVASPDRSAACADKDDYVGGETIQLSSATPETGWHIVGWTGTGDDTSSATINSLSMPVGDHTASVIYDKLGCYHLTLSHTGSGSDPNASPLKSASCTQDLSYTEGENINLDNAVPDAGWFVDSWTGTGDDSSTSSSNSVTMPAMDHSAAVNYKGNCYTLTLGHTGQGTDPIAAPSNSAGCSIGKYTAGEPLNFSSAAPDSGWHITSWTGTDDDSSTSAANAATMPANNHSASVVYEKVCYQLTLGHTGQGSDPVASPTNSTGCSTGYYMLDETINLSGANPTPNWYIEGWYGTNNNSSTLSSNSVTMPGSAHSAGVNYGEMAFPFTCVSNTGNNATYAFSGTVGGFTPAAGDVLAAFTSDGVICTGNESWDGSNIAVAVWGDNDQTQEKDGMNSGETILWQVWDESTNNLCTAVPTFSEGSGDYVPNGINIINHLEVTCPSTQFTDTQVGNTAVTFSSLWLNLVELFGD